MISLRYHKHRFEWVRIRIVFNTTFNNISINIALCSILLEEINPNNPVFIFHSLSIDSLTVATADRGRWIIRVRRKSEYSWYQKPHTCHKLLTNLPGPHVMSMRPRHWRVDPDSQCHSLFLRECVSPFFLFLWTCFTGVCFCSLIHFSCNLLCLWSCCLSWCASSLVWYSKIKSPPSLS